jgi:DNA-binding helix-hairpin-helix protein with protein kinase domain
VVVHGASLPFSSVVEKQPTEEELETARRQAREDAEGRFAYEASGREPDDQPGEQPFAYAAEDVQAEYARVYEEELAKLRARLDD